MNLLAQDEASNQVSLKELLNDWQHNHDFQYSGRDDLLESCFVDSIPFDVDSLKVIIKPCKLRFTIVNDVHVITDKPRRYLINGSVLDEVTNQPIPNASIQCQDQGVLTNEYGQFMVEVPNDTATVKFSHVSYGSHQHEITYGEDNLILVSKEDVKLDEVIVGGTTNSEDSISDEDRYSLFLSSGIPVDAKFFRSLEETLANSHDTVLQETILIARAKQFGIYYHRLDVEKKVGKRIGKVYGFSDGNEVYINPGTPKLRRRTDFYKVEPIDRFLHYKVVERITVPVAGAAPAVISFPAEKLLDIETGKSKTLTRVRLRKLIADDIELLEAFNEEKKKSSKLKLYLETYYERKRQ